MTSAPKSASVWVQAGPATTRVKSTTRRPSRAVGTPFPLGVRSDNCGLPVMIQFSFPDVWFWTWLDRVDPPDREPCQPCQIECNVDGGNANRRGCKPRPLIARNRRQSSANRHPAEFRAGIRHLNGPRLPQPGNCFPADMGLDLAQAWTLQTKNPRRTSPARAKPREFLCFLRKETETYLSELLIEENLSFRFDPRPLTTA